MGAAGIVDLVAARQMHQLFAEEPGMLRRRHDLVGDEIVDEITAHGAGKAEIAGLHRAGAARENPRPGAHGMALEVDGDVHFQ